MAEARRTRKVDPLCRDRSDQARIDLAASLGSASSHAVGRACARVRASLARAGIVLTAARDVVIASRGQCIERVYMDESHRLQEHGRWV